MIRRNNYFGVSTVFDLKRYNCHKIILLLATFVIGGSTAMAAETPNLAKPNVVVPEKITGVDTVTAEQVINILTTDKPPLLVDARIKEDRKFGYIESSVSLPDINTNCQTLAAIAADKEQHLMFYCNGVQCGRSVVSIKVARSCGYNKLSWFKGGFAEWKEKGFQYVKNQ